MIEIFQRMKCPSARACALFLATMALCHPAAAQKQMATSGAGPNPSITSLYFDPLQGNSSEDLVLRALQSNGELAAARLEVERARARLRQAGFRPNPTVEIEQSTGRLAGSPGESATSVGVTLPLELGGQRRRRVELARAELEASESEVADRERRLAGEVLALYAEALSALRELSITEEMGGIDLEMARFVQARVNEGETAPLELSLLQVEVDRLRSRRALVEGRLRAALVRLKALVGIPLEEPLKLREDLTDLIHPLRQPPGTLDAAVEIALRTRPDLRLSRLNEEVARAGLRLARAQAAPDVAVSARYSTDRSLTDLPEPLAPVPDTSRALTFGVSVGIPVFNRNQGGKMEAAVAITQATRRREFLEQTVRAEVQSAYTRYEAARAAVSTFELGVIGRSTHNLSVMRAAYAEGAFTITEVLAEQRRLLDSQRDFTEALSERYNALADLLTAMGTLVGSR